MTKNRIFLSYRRDDSPGYVSRLEDELERAFGDGRVFRDATDIPGGTKWKNVIDANLHSSAVLLLVIGPRWEQIWNERKNDEVNYVALELMRAHELDVPIIPVTLDGTRLSQSLDLGSINFIYDNQFHDISDRQGRWRGDFERLVRLLEGVAGVGPARTGNSTPPQAADTGRKSAFRWAAAVVGVLVVAAVWLGMSAGVDEPDKARDPRKPTDETIVVQDNTRSAPAANANAGAQQPADKTIVVQHNTPADNTTAGSQQRPAIVQSTRPAAVPAPIEPLPDIGGTWQGRDGTIYFVRQHDDGSFAVESPGYGSGQGRFFTNMPRKFEIQMFGIGRGEFSVSASGDKAMGWIQIDGQQEYDTLVRVD